MNKMWFLILLALALLSCNQNKDNGATEDTMAFTFSSENWPMKSSINPNVQLILKDWPEYNALDTSFDALYTVENREDLVLVIEDLIEKQTLLENSTYPEMYDKPQIKSRQKVFKTFFLKTKGNLEYRLDTEEPMLETINAYNKLRDQFNIIAESTLDSILILNE